MKKVLYLDFDDVLNSNAHWESLPVELRQSTEHTVEQGIQLLDSNLTKRVADFVKQVKCEVVVCSNWRYFFSKHDIAEILQHHGIPCHHVLTPRSRKMSDRRDYRVEDITNHVSTLPDGTKWAVLDDAVNESDFPGHVVRPTDGVTEDDIKQLEILFEGDQ